MGRPRNLRSWTFVAHPGAPKPNAATLCSRRAARARETRRVPATHVASNDPASAARISQKIEHCFPEQLEMAGMLRIIPLVLVYSYV